MMTLKYISAIVLFLAVTIPEVANGLNCYNCISLNDGNCMSYLATCATGQAYCVKSKSATNRLTVKGCAATCNAGTTLASLNGVDYPVTKQCCTTDNCNSSSVVLSNSFAILSLLIASCFMKNNFA